MKRISQSRSSSTMKRSTSHRRRSISSSENNSALRVGFASSHRRGETYPARRFGRACAGPAQAVRRTGGADRAFPACPRALETGDRQDIELLVKITEDRGDLMEQIRQSYLAEEGIGRCARSGRA